MFTFSKTRVTSVKIIGEIKISSIQNGFIKICVNLKYLSFDLSAFTKTYASIPVTPFGFEIQKRIF